MSEFPKMPVVLAALALFSGIAIAQPGPPITCSTTAEPPTLRAEGQTEQTADVVISCTGGQIPAPGAPLPQVNISVTLNTTLASRLLAGDRATEALLSIDDPQPNTESPCAPSQNNTVCAPLFAGAVRGTATESSATGTVRNVFRGMRQNDNTIVWLQVPINAPGTQGTRVFRTRNVRAAAPTAATSGQIFAFVSIQDPPPNLHLTSTTVNVAFVQTGRLYAHAPGPNTEDHDHRATPQGRSALPFGGSHARSRP